MNGMSVLVRTGQRASLLAFLPREDTIRSRQPAAQKRALTRP